MSTGLGKLPIHVCPFQVYPVLQPVVHVNDPSVFWQFEFAPQLWVPNWHSLISEIKSNKNCEQMIY